MTKKLLSLLLMVCLTLSFALPAFASASGAYDFYISEAFDDDKGDIQFSHDSANQGLKVTCYVTANEGYAVNTVTVKGKTSGNPITTSLNRNGDGYVFTMPGEDVVVMATFKEDDSDGDYDIFLDYTSRHGDAWLEYDSADEGEYVEFYIESYYGYELDSIEIINEETDDYVNYSRDNVSGSVYTYKFKMPDAPVTIHVYFVSEDDVDDDEGEYEVNIDFNEMRGNAWTSADYADESTRVRIFAEPDNGYFVEDVVITSRGSSRDGDVPCMYNEDEDYYSFLMPDDDVFINVYFTRGSGSSSTGRYDITIYEYDTDYGEIWLDRETADSGNFIKINCEPAPGVKIKKITACDDDNNPVTVDYNNLYYFFYMPASDVTVYVTFEGTPTVDDTEYAVNILFDEELGDAWISKTKYKSGETVRVNVEPNSNATVSSVVVKRASGTTVANVRKSASGQYYYFTMPASAVSVRVTFTSLGGQSSSSTTTTTSYYAIDCDYNRAYGSVDITDEAKSGKKVEFTVDDGFVHKIRGINLSSGMSFKIYEGDYDGDYYFTMPSSDVYIDVLFDEDVEGNDYDVELADYATSRGEVSISTNSADYGDKVKVYVQPKAGYEVDTLLVYKGRNKVSIKQINDYCYYFTMPSGDVEVSVAFEKAQGDYDVDTSYNTSHGTVTLSEDTADSGDTIDVTVTPKTGYKIKSVSAKKTGTTSSVTLKKDGEGSYTFTMPSANVTITAEFELIVVEYTITNISDASFGTTTVAAKSEKNKAVTITATPKTGYNVSSVKVTDAAGKAVTVTKKSATTWSFTMPASNVKVNVTYNAASHICPSKEYKDIVTTEWYHDAVDYAISKGLMNGVSTTEKIFNPSGTVTRAMVTTVLWRIAGEPKSTSSTLPYTDVPANEWYTEAVRWAAEKGLLTNVSNSTKFEPNSTITREQFATMIYRFEQHKAGNTLPRPTDNISKYSDMVKVSIWAVDALNWCGANKVINGNANGTVDPQGSTTRAQLAQILYNYKDFN